MKNEIINGHFVRKGPSAILRLLARNVHPCSLVRDDVAGLEQHPDDENVKKSIGTLQPHAVKVFLYFEKYGRRFMGRGTKSLDLEIECLYGRKESHIVPVQKSSHTGVILFSEPFLGYIGEGLCA